MSQARPVQNIRNYTGTFVDSILSEKASKLYRAKDTRYSIFSFFYLAGLVH